MDFFRWFGLIFGVIEKTYLMAKWVAYNLYYISWKIAISSETNFLPKEWTYDKNLLNINLRMVVFAQKIFYTLFPEKQQKSLKIVKAYHMNLPVVICFILSKRTKLLLLLQEVCVMPSIADCSTLTLVRLSFFFVRHKLD